MKISLAIVALLMGIAYCDEQLESCPGHPVVKRQAEIDATASLSLTTNRTPRPVTVIDGYHIKYLLPQCNQRICHDLCKDNWCSSDCQPNEAIVPATAGNGNWCHCYKGGKNAICDRDACKGGAQPPPRNQIKPRVSCQRCNNECANDRYCYGTCYNYNLKRMGNTCTCYTGDKCGQCPFLNFPGPPASKKDCNQSQQVGDCEPPKKLQFIFRKGQGCIFIGGRDGRSCALNNNAFESKEECERICLRNN